MGLESGNADIHRIVDTEAVVLSKLKWDAATNTGQAGYASDIDKWIIRTGLSTYRYIGGDGTFLGLDDTPNSYNGDSGKVLVVNSTEDGIEFSGAINTLESTSTEITSNKNFISEIWSDSSLRGFDFTDNGDGTFNIGSGTAVLRQGANEEVDLKVYDVLASDTFDISNYQTLYAIVIWNNGNPLTTTTTDVASAVLAHGSIGIWAVTRVGTKIIATDVRYNARDFVHNWTIKTLFSQDITKQGGTFLLTVNASKQISWTAGLVFLLAKPITIPAYNSATTPFVYSYGNSGVGFTRVPAQTVLNWTKYDNNGVLATVNTNKYGNHWIFTSLDGSNQVNVVYGKKEYNSVAEAKAAPLPADRIPELAGFTSIEDFFQVVVSGGGVVEAIVDLKKAVKGGDLVSPTSHNTLGGLQGGQANEYYHLTEAQHAEAILLKTLQKVTDNGNTTTNDIILNSSNLVADGADSTTIVSENGLSTNTTTGASFDTYATDSSSGFSGQAKNADGLFEQGSVAVEPYTRDDNTKTVAIAITKQPICAEALNPATNTALVARGFAQEVAQTNNGKLAVVTTSQEFVDALFAKGIKNIFIAPEDGDKLVVEIANTITINSDANHIKVFGGMVEFKILTGSNLIFTFGGVGSCKITFLNYVEFDSSVTTVTGTNAYLGLTNVFANSAISFSTSTASSYERSRGEDLSGTILQGFFENTFRNLYEASNIDNPVSYLTNYLVHDYKNTSQEPTLPASGNLITSEVTVVGGVIRISQILMGRDGKIYYRYNSDNSNFNPWTEIGSSIIEAGFYESTFKFYLATTDLGSIVAQRLRFFEQKAVVAFTISKIRLWASVNGGSITVAIYKGTVNNLTLAGQGVVSFTSAGYNEATLDTAVSISAGEEYWFVLFCTNAQTGSNTGIAAITAGAPLTSTNLSTANAVLLYYIHNSDNLPSVITTGMQKESAGAKIPFADFIQ